MTASTEASAPTRRVVMTAPTLAPEAVALLEAAGCAVSYTAPYPSPEAVAAIVGDVQADAIISRQGRITAAAMDASPRLRVVARHGVGVDDVDLAAAAARGIMVTRAPGSNAVQVAEHAMAMMLALIKDLPGWSAAVAGGGWRGSDGRTRDVAGLRLGLFGCGAIGREAAHRAAAFGMVVTAFTRSPAADGIARAKSLEALLEASDVLSVHAPLDPSTRGAIGAAALARLPRGAIVVNTSRGGIVDEAALLAALDSGHLAGAGLDVFGPEPPAPENPLRRHPRVIATPHVAGVTDRALTAMGVMAAECVAAVLSGGRPPPDRIV